MPALYMCASKLKYSPGYINAALSAISGILTYQINDWRNILAQMKVMTGRRQVEWPLLFPFIATSDETAWRAAHTVSEWGWETDGDTA